MNLGTYSSGPIDAEASTEEVSPVNTTPPPITFRRDPELLFFRVMYLTCAGASWVAAVYFMCAGNLENVFWSLVTGALCLAAERLDKHLTDRNAQLPPGNSPEP